MTEAQWHTSRDPEAMLKVLRGCTVASERKLRLYACACATRAIEGLLNCDPSREVYQRVVATAERLAEGVARPDEVRAADEAVTAVQVAANRIDAGMAGAVGCTLEREAYRGACGVVAELLRYEQEARGKTMPDSYADLLGCIFGNPYRGLNVGFRPVRFDGSWLTSTVVVLARQMYASQDYSAMPILADALQDAGCDNEYALSHCQSDGPHVRGCWVLDLVLA